MAQTCYLRQITPDELVEYLNGAADAEQWIGGPDTISLNTAWDDLLIFYTGGPERTASPVSRAILGHQCLDDPSFTDEYEVALGYTYYLMPEEVKMIAVDLLKITVEQVRDKVTLMANSKKTDFELNAGLEEIIKEFQALQDFYEAASQRGNAVFMSIT